MKRFWTVFLLLILQGVGFGQTWVSPNTTDRGVRLAEEYGAVGDSSTYSGAAINRAIASLSRGTVELGAGVFIIEETIIIRENIELIGRGPERTKLVLANGTNDDVIRTADFSSQTGQNIWTDAEGIHRNFSVRGMTIDGNRANNSAGYGIRIYGKGYILSDLTIQNTQQDGLYTEAGSSGGVSSGIDMPEAIISNVRVFDTGGDGIDYRGPHDGLIAEAFAGEADSVGLKMVSRSGKYIGGAVLNFLHVYSCSTGIVLDSTALKADYIESESNFYEGMHIKPGSWVNATQVNLYKNGRFDQTRYGLRIEGDNSRIASGQVVADNGPNGVIITGDLNKIYNLTVSGANQGGVGINLSGSRNTVFADVANFSVTGGEGMRINNLYQSRIDAQITNCDTLLNFLGSAGANLLSFQFGAAGSKVMAGAPSLADIWTITGTGTEEKVFAAKVTADTIETTGNTVYVHPQTGVDFYFAKTKKTGSAAWLNFGAEADVNKDAGIQFFRQNSGTSSNQTKVIIHDGSGSYKPVFEWRGNGVHFINNGAYRQEVVNDTLCLIKVTTSDTTRLVPAR